MLLLLLIASTCAETIYTVRTGGTCETPSLPITDKTLCETQATVQHWPDKVTVVSSSKNLPQGCVFRTQTQDVRLYAADTTTECSNELQCLCQTNAPLCQIGTNRQSCICQSVLCTSSTGLVCSNDATCTHAPTCSDGSNENVCKCGATDCTPLSGLVCTDNTCVHAETCPNADGSVPFADLCQCGAIDCPTTQGRFCHQQQNTCIHGCSSGKWVNNLVCTPCTTPGYYCPSGGTLAETQYPCPAGRFSLVSGIGDVSQCQKCAPGLYSSEEARALPCTDSCSQGRYSSETALVSNEKCLGRCAAGRYSSELGRTSECNSVCPAGRYSNEEGLTTVDDCNQCSKGRYSAETGQTTDCRFQCPLGSFSDNVGIVSITQCKICSANKYQDEQGMTQCKGCPNERTIKDTTTTSKHDSIDDCVEDVPDCLATQYILNNKCQSCQPSFECDGTTMTDCKPGYFCTGDGLAQPCPTGKYGEDSSQVSEKGCKLCNEGSYQNVVGQTWCSRGCPRGYFGNVPGASSLTDACQKCPFGHMCPALFMNRPVQCPIGHYQSHTAAEVCDICPVNTYANKMATTSCTDCGKNKDGEPLKTSGMGANNFAQCALQPMACRPGRFPNTNNICATCRPGLFGNAKGTTCHLCPTGFYQPLYGQTNCSKCTSIRCKKLPGCAENSDTPPQVWSTNATTQYLDAQQDSAQTFAIIIYTALLGTIVLIVMTHRLCPQCFRHADIMFSGDHVIEDTHAKRVINTRLGAAMTLALPFVVAGISVFVFTSNNTIQQTGLVPLVHQGQYNFQNIDIEFKTEAATSNPNCTLISVNTVLDCTHTSMLEHDFVCAVTIVCNILSPFVATNIVSITVPNTMHRSIVSIVPSEWNYTQINVSQVLNPSEGLGGSSIVNVGVFRSLFSEHFVEHYGLQIVPHKVILEETSEAIHNHQIDVQFNVDENMFVHTVSTKLGIITRLGTVLTLTISALSILRVSKLCLGSAIDKCFTKMYQTPPNDVKTRNTILMEMKEMEMRETIPTDLQICNNILLQEENREPVVYTDTESGCKYMHNPLTRKSVWVTEEKKETNVL